MFHFIGLFVLVAALCLLLKRRFEFVLPGVVLLQMLGLTLLAMVRKLMWADGLAIGVLVAAAALLLYALLAQKATPLGLAKDVCTYLLTPGLVCFAALGVFFLYMTEPMVVWWRDDVNHWALQVKSLLAYNGLVDISQNLNPFFGTYTPGIQVIQWWVIHAIGEFSEHALYFTQYLLSIVFLLPFVGRLRWKQAWLLPVIFTGLVGFPTWGNVATYAFLGVDTTLALCFGYVLTQIWRQEKGDVPMVLSIGLGLCGLVLMKQTGLVFAAAAVLLMIILKRDFFRKNTAMWLCALSPFLLWGGWMLYCRAFGLSGFHVNNFSEKIGQMLSGTYIPPDGGDGVLAALWHAFTTEHTESILWNTTAPLYVPKLVWLVLICLAPLGLARLFPEKKLWRVSVFFAGVTVLYVVMQYASFFTVFYDETNLYTHQHQDNMSLLMERYMAPVVLGFGTFLVWMGLDAFSVARVKEPALAWVCMGLVVAVLALTTNWAMIYESLPEQYSQTDRVMGAEVITLMDHSWGEDLEEYENAYVLTGLENNSDFLKNLRYTFAPVKFALPEPGFTQTPEALAEHLLESAITHVICFDDVNMLYEPSTLLTEDEYLDTYTLYEVLDDGDGVYLEEFW